MPLQISFVKTSKGVGSRMLGKLKWLGDEYEVVTGGYGKGAIPYGLAIVKDEHKSGFKATHYTIAPAFDIPLSRFKTLLKKLAKEMITAHHRPNSSLSLTIIRIGCAGELNVMIDNR